METKNKNFYIKRGMLINHNELLFNMDERRNELLDEICGIMNDMFVMDIEDLGFPKAYFRVEDFENEPEIVLYFEEKDSRSDFETEDEWMQYQCDNIEICYEYFEKNHPDLDIICIPEEYEP